MPDPPTGTVTLLFTDINGSTRLLQQLGDRYPHVLAECRHLLRTAFQQHNGHEVDTQGDSFFVAFARASDAVSAAADTQRALATYDWSDGVLVPVRMGCIRASHHTQLTATSAWMCIELPASCMPGMGGRFCSLKQRVTS